MLCVLPRFSPPLSVGVFIRSRVNPTSREATRVNAVPRVASSRWQTAHGRRHTADGNTLSVRMFSSTRFRAARDAILTIPVVITFNDCVASVARADTASLGMTSAKQENNGTSAQLPFRGALNDAAAGAAAGAARASTSSPSGGGGGGGGDGGGGGRALH